jgi:DNA mismatch repair ATPase MutS
MKAESAEYYFKEHRKYLQNIERLKKQIKSLSSMRVLWFSAGLIGLYFVSATNLITVSFYLLVYILVFVFLAIRQSRCIEQKKEAEVYEQLFKNEIASLKGDYSAFDSGKTFIDVHHPYSTDLDIFGDKSVFQMLNRSFSARGLREVAKRLKFLEKDAESILEYQKAVKELAKNAKWMHQFRALGILAFTKKSSFAPDPNQLADNLGQWISRPSSFNRGLFKMALILFPFASVVFLFLYFFNQIDTVVFLLYLFTVLGFTGFFAKKINQQHQELSKQSSILFRFQKLIQFIEEADFKATNLKNIQSKFTHQNFKASQGLKKLGNITQAFDSRLNIFGWLLLNYFLLWDIRQCRRLEKWKVDFRSLPTNTFEAIAQMEVLVSLGVFYYNREDLILPELSEKEFCFQAKSLGHPLMDAETRVANDIYFESLGEFNVITGANMAGKSTYLRTVGVNLVLALIGGPVCALEFKISILNLFTSIKTSDSLSNNESYFYAELLRLQRIIQALDSEDNYFIILDEILKGTNSKDKEQGSKALVRKLIHKQAVGIIATHDLQLAELSKSFPNNVKTACFEVEIVNDQLNFDYRLREGVSQNLNATFLMKQMGIS